MSDGANEHMLLWPVVALIGFLVLVGVVVVLGTDATDRYEREQRARARFTSPPTQPLRIPRTNPRSTAFPGR